MTDLKLALRLLRNAPGFSLIAIVTFALGIGASTVVFGVVKGILYRSFGVHAEEEVFWLKWRHPENASNEEEFSWTDYQDLLTEAKSFEQLSLVGRPGATWEHGGRAEILQALSVSPSLFDLLPVRAMLGRSFVESDAEPSAASVVMISHELWQSRFGGDMGILGRNLHLNDEDRTVVGILPPNLEFPLGHPLSRGTGAGVFSGIHDIWMPLQVRGTDRTARGHRMFWLIGRLKPGTAESSARAELASITSLWAQSFPDTNRGLRIELIALRDQVLGRTRHAIQVLAAAVAGVLLVCCVNISNLLLARGVMRERELAVRQALGASRARLLRSQFVESLTLSFLGGALGVVLAGVIMACLRRFGPPEVPFLSEIALDGNVLAFVAILSFAVALLAGSLPAIRQIRADELETLKSGTRTTSGPRLRLWQQGLLVAQVALVLVLLTSSILLLESFRRLAGVDLGYQPKSVITADLNGWDIPTNEDNVRMYRQIHERLAQIPGVEAVGTIQSIPLTGKWDWEERAQVFGRPLPLEDQPRLAITFVAFDYFQAMGIPLLAGRYFQPSELRDDGYAPVAVLNETAAARLFPGESPLGKRFSISSSPDRFYEVIGVVSDTRDAKLELSPQGRFYLLYTWGGSQVVLQTSRAPHEIIPRMRTAFAEFAPRLITGSIRPMTRILSDALAERRFLMAMLTVYAVVAAGIAAVGIFGVASYQVAQRTNEFGVRLALGATRQNLIRLVLGQTGRMTIAGLAVGLLLSLAGTRLLANQLFDLSPQDPVSLAAACLLLLAVALASSLLPARRAAKVDPVIALRSE